MNAAFGSDRTRRRVAYLTPEIGRDDNQYSGGLGLLACDLMGMTGALAEELGVDITCVSLLYTEGYGNQFLRHGAQEMVFSPLRPLDLGFVPVMVGDTQLMVTVDMAGSPCHALVWESTRDLSRRLYLDANHDGNPMHLRRITMRLYDGEPGSEERLRQELLLGLGGVMAIQMTGGADIYHLNDPHAAIASIQRIRQYMELDALTLDQAIRLVRATTLFTTHTPVKDGIDKFSWELVDRYFENWARACTRDGIDALSRLHELGSFPREPGLNMAALAVRTSGQINGVSRRHQLVSQELLQPLFPGLTVPQVPIGFVTNGVDPRPDFGWTHPLLAALYERYVGADWWKAGPAQWQNFREVPPEELWHSLKAVTARGIEQIRQLLLAQCRAVGWAESDINWTQTVLEGRGDDHPLIIGFGRRATGYKRLDLLMLESERLLTIARDLNRPVCFIFAGKAHRNDSKGQAAIRAVLELAQRHDVRAHIIFLANYSPEIAQIMVQTVHVWLNTPMPPLEAAGTSGMKVACNGGLNLSVNDGWWWERGSDAVGWTIPYADAVDNPKAAAAILDLIKRDIVPLFYDRGELGVPDAWIRMVINEITILMPQVSAADMVRGYNGQYYQPMAEAAATLIAELLPAREPAVVA